MSPQPSHASRGYWRHKFKPQILNQKRVKFVGNEAMMRRNKNMNMRVIYTTLVGALALCACNDQSPVLAEVTAQSANDSTIVIDVQGFEMQYVVPKVMLAHEHAIAEYNDMTGILEISVGDRFQIDIINDSLSISDLKLDLANDPFFTYKFYDEGETSLTYQAVLPTGDDFFYHFVRSVEINNQYYFISSRDGSEFTLKNVTDMRKILNSLKAVQ